MLIFRRIGLILILLSFVASCKKSGDNGSDFNTLKITSGANSGFTFTYSPNMGFWSSTGSNARYVHLVFGDTDNNTTQGKNILSILYYDDGTGLAVYPGGQIEHVIIGVTINDQEKYYLAQDVQLTVANFTDTHYTGTLSGTFISSVGSETINATMNIDLQMVEL